MKFTRLALCALALAATTLDAGAAAVTFSGFSGTRAASASFAIIGGQLQVVLTNTSTFDVLVPPDVLTGFFFNVAGSPPPTLTRVSAISGGPTYLGNTNVSGAGTTVGGEWAYVSRLSQYGANSGISSTGLGLFGPGQVFPGTNLSGPVEPDGLQYGLASAGDIQSTGNRGVLGNELTKNSVTFTLGGLPANFSLASISNLTFQYGTSLADPHFGGGFVGGNAIPEPESIALLGLGLVLLSTARRRRA